MDQLIEFFTKLFDTADWPPRWVCGKWSDFHGWLYIGSDIAIWLAYFMIPVILIWFIQRRPKIAFLPVFYLFIAFILFCGATHLIDALIFWWPGYRLSALLRFCTAVVSLFTVFALIRDLPKALKIVAQDPSPGTEDKLRAELKEREVLIASLRNEINQLRKS